MHPPANKKIRQHDYKDIYEITEMLITNWNNIVTDESGIVELELCQSKTGCGKVCFTESPDNDSLTFIKKNFISKQEISVLKLHQFKSNSVSDTESSDANEDARGDSTIIKSIKISLSTSEPLLQEESPQILVVFYVFILFYFILMFFSYLF